MKNIILYAINYPFRLLFLFWSRLNALLTKYVFLRSGVLGIVNLNFSGLKFKMFSKRDDGIVTALFFHKNEFSEFRELTLFKELSLKSRVILDIGANTGVYSIISSKTNPMADVYSFEPYSINLERLRTNIEINHLENRVKINKIALGDSNSKIKFAVPENDNICDVSSADTAFTNKFYRKWINYKEVEVEQVTLDSFLDLNKITQVDLIKIDVENYELPVFRGAKNTLMDHSPILQVEIFVDKERIDYFDKNLTPLGYYCYFILKEGLFRTNSLMENPDCKNFIFSKKKSLNEYLSFSNMQNLIHEIA